MEELRRSGRFKCKGPIVEENTIEEAYSISVDDESSEDDFIVTSFGNKKGVHLESKIVAKSGTGTSVSNTYVEKGKKGKEHVSLTATCKMKSDMIGDGKKTSKIDKKNVGESSKGNSTKRVKKKRNKSYVFQSRTSPHSFYNAIVTLKPIQKACLARIGFSDMLDFKVDGIPSKLGFYVVDNFNKDNMEIKLNEGSIVITKQSIGEMLGIRNERVDIMEEENVEDDEMVKDWVDQFKNVKEITPSVVKYLIRKSKIADMNFKLNFIVLFTSLMGGVKPKGICDTSVLYKISRKTDLAKINWCEYVWGCLKTCKDVWNDKMSNSYFLGPITFLTMMYVDGTVCTEFNVSRKRPPKSFWTAELLKEREYEEIMAGGIGMGELQGPFVEEEGDPMPEDEEGFLWKLNKYVENIRKERQGFERTFEAANEVFPDNSFIADVYQQYRATLHYKQGVSHREGCSNVSGDNADEPHKISALQEYVEKTSKNDDSPIYE